MPALCQRRRPRLIRPKPLFSRHSRSLIVDSNSSVGYTRLYPHPRSARPLNLRTKTAQLRVLYVLVSALVFLATAWSVSFSASVSELRSDINTRVGWLIQVRGIERAFLGDAEENVAPTPLAGADSALALADEVRPVDPELAAMIVVISRSAEAPDRALNAAGDVVDEIRRGNGAISEALGVQIDRLNQVVAIVAASSFLIVLLFGWGFSRERIAGRALLKAESLALQMDYLAASSPAMLYTAECAEPYDFAFVSPNVARIFGLPPGQLTQPTGRRQWVHPDDAGNAERGLIVAKSRGRHVHEYRVATVQGDYRWVRDEVRAPDEGAELLVGCIIDITDRRVADAALKGAMASMEVRVREAVLNVEAKAEQLEAIFGAAMDAVILVQEDGIILQANEACGAIFGHDPATLAHENAGVLFDDETWSPPTSAEVEERVGRRSDGSVLPVEISTGHTAGVFGKPVMVLVVRDISERVESRERLEERNTALARTNADLKTFTAAASHDMKEPLRKIRAFAGLLGETDENLSEPTLQYMSYMNDAAGRLTHLVDDLVEYAQAGRTTPHIEPIELNELLRCLIDDLEVSITETDTAIEFDPLGGVRADAHQLRRVFQNLIANAVRYTKEGQAPRIHISRVDSDGFAVIRVADKGIGFEEEYADHIFAPFKRLRRSNKTDGTGIGLAICRKIVQAHGGTITAEGVPDQGATFTIRLPLNGRPAALSDA